MIFNKSGTKLQATIPSLETVTVAKRVKRLVDEDMDLNKIPLTLRLLQRESRLMKKSRREEKERLRVSQSSETTFLGDI